LSYIPSETNTSKAYILCQAKFTIGHTVKAGCYFSDSEGMGVGALLLRMYCFIGYMVTVEDMESAFFIWPPWLLSSVLPWI